MNRYVSQVSQNPDFGALEEEVLRFWEEASVFQRSLEIRQDAPEYVFYDGPPFANGLPHYGHLLTGYVKDVIARFQTMKGRRVERRFGWDCHGLPAEMSAEKELGLSGRTSILEYGVEKFNHHCATAVLRYTQEWHRYVTRQGRWVDFENSYKTMDKSYMESLMWGFKQLYEKGFVYESVKVMPYSWACETPLSNFEIRVDDAYRKKVSKAAVVSFSAAVPEWLQERLAVPVSSCKLLAWTTTPWTLPSNLALAVNPEMTYLAVVMEGVCYIAQDPLQYRQDLERRHQTSTVQATAQLSGAELVGVSYAPLFSYFRDTVNAFTILGASFVSDAEGTGLVHIAPGFGEDDFLLCQEHQIPIVCPVNDDGTFAHEVSDFSGRNVLEANDDILQWLKQEKAVVNIDQYTHDYPHCWRTDTPLIYRAMPSWYIAVSRIREQLVDLNKKIHWIPSSIGTGQFAQWLCNAHDWAVSRKRFFGTPIPIWKSDDPRYPRVDVYGSIAELERDFGVVVQDLHKPFIDTLIRPNPDDPTGRSMMRRVPDVFDCWFESGSMPYASVPLAGDQGVTTPHRFPADFVVEYTAQTRGWFYTMLVLSAMLFEEIPFKNCICHGVFLDENGKKLSKRLGNYIDPYTVMQRYGSDALRIFMMSSSAMVGGTVALDQQCEGVKEVLRLQIKPVWNAFVFLILYANLDAIAIDCCVPAAEKGHFDRYIYVVCCQSVQKIENALLSYDLNAATAAIEAFFDTLNNWYIRCNRKRFWREKYTQDKQDAYDTLYTVLLMMVKAIAPLMPFLSEVLYAGLTNNGKYTRDHSVHLQDFPSLSSNACSSEKDVQLCEQMGLVRNLCTAAHAIRNKNKVRIRQPLRSVTIIGHFANTSLIDVMKAEMNVKEVHFVSKVEAHCKVEPKIHLPAVGRRIPKAVKYLLANREHYTLLPDGGVRFGEVTLLPEEVDCVLVPHRPECTEVLSRSKIAVMLDLEIDEDLWQEGVVRDVVRVVQSARQGFCALSDRIILYLEVDDSKIQQACDRLREYLMEQTLTHQLHFTKIPENVMRVGYTVEEIPIVVGIQKK